MIPCSANIKKKQARIIVLDVDIRELKNELSLLGENPRVRQEIIEAPEKIPDVIVQEPVVDAKPEVNVKSDGKLHDPN